MAYEIDLEGLEKNYSIMSAEEFALLRRSELTQQAAEIYDRVAAIRRAADDAVLEVAPVSSDTPPQAKMANSEIRILPVSAGLFANTLGFDIDLKGLEKNYSNMSAEEFALLRRSDLTPEAAEIYDQVAAIRRAGDDSALEVASVGSDTSRPNTAPTEDATGAETFEDIVEWAYSTLPQRIKDLPDFPGIQIVDEPPEGYLKTMPGRGGPLGMFLGVPRNERHSTYVLQTNPVLIFIFRGPIMRYSKGRDLRSEVKQTVWHEVAHWLGYDEEGVEELGL